MALTDLTVRINICFKNKLTTDIAPAPTLQFSTNFFVPQHKRRVINIVTVLLIPSTRNYFCRSYKYSFIDSVESRLLRRRLKKVAKKFLSLCFLFSVFADDDY